MRRMLESHMDDETKRQLLDKIDEIEREGLAYQQHGVPYRNAHYDMSFILKNVTLDEFRHLKTLLGQSSDKLNTATQDNYQTISFTATEYEQLKKELAQQKVRSLMPVCFASFQFLSYITYPIFFIASFFITSPAEKLINQLKNAFDFDSLITALDIYVTNYDKWDYHQREEAWMKVGKAQRDVPAHVAHEYWVFRYIQPKSAMATKLAILKYKLTKKCQFITGSKLISIENSLEPLSEIFIMH